jgi:hypothetical protein
MKLSFCFLLFFTISVYSQPKLNYSFTEFGILSYPSTGAKPVRIVGEIERMDNVKIIPPMKKARTKKKSFFIYPGKDSEIKGEKGFSIFIPADTFVTPSGEPITDRIEIELHEQDDKLDVMTSGMGLKYYDQLGKDYYIESAGMFEINAKYKSQILLIRPEKFIKVEMPNHFPKKSFRVFKMNPEGSWEEYVQSKNTPPNPKTSEQDNITLFLDKTGFFTRSEFRSNIACLKGTILDPKKILGKNIQVFSLGLDYGAYFTVWVKGNSFEVNVYRSSKARIIVVDDKGNLGMSAIVQTPDKPGNARKPEGPDNFKMDIGEITIQTAPPDIFKDRDNFLKQIESDL